MMSKPATQRRTIAASEKIAGVERSTSGLMAMAAAIGEAARAPPRNTWQRKVKRLVKE